MYYEDIPTTCHLDFLDNLCNEGSDCIDDEVALSQVRKEIRSKADIVEYSSSSGNAHSAVR